MSRTSFASWSFACYWDGEETPSVLAPIGDFFGTGHGEYTEFASLPLSIGRQKAMNSYWFMPFEKGAKVTIENQGTRPVGTLYYHVDYRTYRQSQFETKLASRPRPNSLPHLGSPAWARGSLMPADPRQARRR
jgi:hypothetical protein